MNNHKEIGLITYYGDNYGGCLQAYALQQTIESLGFTPYILKVKPTVKGSGCNRLSAIMRVLRNPIAYLKRRPYMQDASHNEVYRSLAFEKYRKEFLTFDETFILTEDTSDIPEKYRTFVCGSDQIWNPNLYGVNPIWTLKFAPAGSRKIAYAPSLGISKIPKQFVSDFKNNLQDFTYLSCREQDGATCLSEILGTKVDVVLDPTLLLTSEKWHNFARSVNIKQPYIFCYLFGGYEYIAEVKERVKRHFNMDVVCLPYNLRELKASDIKLYDITPNQFVWLIENARYVVTDSFHASVFSIKMQTPFVSLKRFSDNDKKSMNSRLYTLLEKVGLGDRLINENMISEIDSIIEKKIDFTTANSKLSILMKRDIAKLSNALSNE